MLLNFIVNLLKIYIIEEETGTDVYFAESTLTGSFIYIVLIIVLWFVSGFLLAFWVYKDLKKRQKKGYFYPVIVLLTSIVGFLIYLMVRNNEKCALEDEKTCNTDDEVEEVIEEAEELKKKVEDLEKD